MTPSDEQMTVIQAIKDGFNVQVDAVAGSGKTTTILHMSMSYPNKNIFQITYNNMLKKEVRKKINRLCIENVKKYLQLLF